MVSIQAELKSFGTASMDVPNFNLRTWQPENPRKFRIYIEAAIGPKDALGEEVFGFDVCSPWWLVDERLPRGYEFCRLLLMDVWSYTRLEQSLTDLCNRTTGDTWDAVGIKLGRFSVWEFEDYHQ